MHPFTYVKTTNPGDAVNKMKTASVKSSYIGGGTCIVDLMKLNVMNPSQIVDVRKNGLESDIKDTGDSIVISGAATNSAVAHSALIQKELPVISEAILSGASPQLRNAATVAGNILQRTRCYYFRDTAMPCNKREPGSGCPAIDGYNRIHAVLGTSSQCIATHPSDMCVAMAALDAVIRVSDGTATRDIPFVDFHTLPGDHPEIESVLKPDEVIVSVEIKKSELARNSHYFKVRDRASFSFAVTSAAVAVQVDGGKITAVRLAMGGVGTKPWRSPKAEALMLGKPATEETFRLGADAALADAVPQKYNKFKIDLAKRTISRAFEELQKA